jgi:hypothetical protein
VADLAGFDLLIQCFERFLKGRKVAVMMLIAQLTEVVGRSLWPMQLIQIDPVGLQAFEAVVQGRNNVCTVMLELAVTNVANAIAGASNFAGQHPVGAITALFEVLTDDLFSLAVSLGARWHRVHFSSVDEVDAIRLSTCNLCHTLAGRILLAPGHGAQAQAADLDVAAAELAVIHCKLLKNGGSV